MLLVTKSMGSSLTFVFLVSTVLN